MDGAPNSEYPESWPYTQIALMEDFGEGKGVEVYTGIEAGMISPGKITRDASDEDISKIVETKLKVGEDSGIGTLANWINGLETEQDCAPLLKEEKERISKMVENVILESKGKAGLDQYKSLLGLPYKSEN